MDMAANISPCKYTAASLNPPNPNHRRTPPPSSPCFHSSHQPPFTFKQLRSDTAQMRTNRVFFQPVSKTAAVYYHAASAAPETAQSQWHSPVPYLFGGFAAMLGLIALALLILACAYWKLFGGDVGDAEGGSAAEKQEIGADAKKLPAFEEKFLVIMAGEVRPTFLATPVSSNRASPSSSSSFDGKSNQNHETENSKIQNQAHVITVGENGETSQEFRLIQN